VSLCGLIRDVGVVDVDAVAADSFEILVRTDPLQELLSVGP